MRQVINYPVLIKIISATLLCILAGIASGGFYYAYGSDIFAAELISGYFTGVPEHFFFTFGFHLFTGYFLKALYVAWPAFQWYDGWSLLLILAAYMLGAWWLLGNTRSRYWVVVLLFYSVLMFQNIKCIEITKTAYFLSLFSLLHLIAPAKPLQWYGKCLFIAGFALGLFTRCEAGYLAGFTSVLIAFSILHPLSFVKLKQLLAPYFYITPVLLFTGFILNKPWSEVDEAYLTIRPYQFTLWDFKQSPATFCPGSLKDSTVILAAQNHFFADEENINASSFKKSCVIPKDKTFSSFLNFFNDGTLLTAKLQDAERYFNTNYKYETVVLILLLLTAAIGSNTRKTIFVPLVFLMLVMGTVMLLIATIMKIEAHVMEPLFMSVWFVVLLLFFRQNLGRSILAVSVALIIAGEIISTSRLITTVKQRLQEVAPVEQLAKSIEHLPTNSIVCFDIYTLVKLHARLFAENKISSKIEPYSLDNGFIFLYPSWKEKTQHLFGSKRLEDVFRQNFHVANRDLYFVFWEDRNRLFEKYSRNVYNHEIKFSELIQDKPNGELEELPCKIYRCNQQ